MKITRNKKGIDYYLAELLQHNFYVFVFIWVFQFLLYLPAAQAGFVADFTGWLDQVRNHTFLEHVNRTNYHGHSLYQATQLMTWIFYQMFGTNAWLWHLLALTIHTLNAYLLYVLSITIMEASFIMNAKKIAFCGAILFCITPSISETIVWESAYHFLQGLTFILLILFWTVKFIKTEQSKYIIYALSIFAFSTFSLEIFYITPWLVLMLALYFLFSFKAYKAVSIKTILYFFVPMLVLFGAHLLIYHIVYGNWVSHIESDVVKAVPLDGLGKPAKYLFHLLFLGRFFPEEIKKNVYAFLDSKGGLIAFYTILTIGIAFVIFRWKNLTAKTKFATLLFVWLLTSLAIIIPLWFGNMLLVIYDRYTYFACAFLFLLLSVLFSGIANRYLRGVIFFVFCLINLKFTVQANRLWMKSAHVISALMTTVPEVKEKTVLLLNLPQCMRGIAMIGAEKESEFRLLHDLLLPQNKMKAPVYDVLAYNMLSPKDGVHAQVKNDSVVLVTLNQWGTWWWFEAKGAYNYQNKDFSIKLIDGGNTGLSYNLTLKKPADSFVLFFQTGDKWKRVDWNNKNNEQY